MFTIIKLLPKNMYSIVAAAKEPDKLAPNPTVSQLVGNITKLQREAAVSEVAKHAFYLLKGRFQHVVMWCPPTYFSRFWMYFIGDTCKKYYHNDNIKKNSNS